MNKYDGYETDDRIMDAIEHLVNSEFGCGGECGNPGCDGSHPESCDNPAVMLWCDGGRDDELRSWLDKHHNGWRDDGPLSWGAGELREEA